MNEPRRNTLAKKLVEDLLKRQPKPVVEGQPNIPAKLAHSARQWVADRVDNGEPLMFGEFVRFMVDLGWESSQAMALKSYVVKKYTDEKAKSKRAAQKLADLNRSVRGHYRSLVRWPRSKAA